MKIGWVSVHGIATTTAGRFHFDRGDRFTLESDIASPGGQALDARPASWFLLRLGTRLCALPLDNVVETMRPLPIEPLAGAPRFVQGVSIVRGLPVPVVDAAVLFGEHEVQPRRWVIIAVGDRHVALMAGDVLGIRSVDAMPGNELPPLLRDAVGEVVSAIGTLDAELLLFLSAVRIVPQATYESPDLASPDPERAAP